VRLNSIISIFCLFAIIAEIGIAGALVQTFQEMRAADLQICRIQDQVRQREILYMRDLTRFSLEAQQWVEHKQAPRAESVDQLISWFESDLSELRTVLSYNPDAKKYLKSLDDGWWIYRQCLKELLLALKEGNETSVVPAYEKLMYSSQALSVRLNSEDAGLYNPQLVGGEVLAKQLKLSNQFESLLLGALAYHIVLALVLACFCKWGPPQLLAALNDRTTLVQKFLLLVWVPTVFELVFLGLLAIMFYHGNESLMKVERFRTLERIHHRLYQDVVTLVSQGAAAKPELTADSKRMIAELRRLLKDRQQQIFGLDVIESGIERIIALRQDAIRSRNQSDSQRSQLDEQLIGQIFERVIIYIRYGFPDVGQQTVLKVKQQMMGKEVETAKRLEQFMLLGVLFNFMLSLLLAAYFNRAASMRLAVITENILRFSRHEPLQPELSGADEIARLDGFFHEMAQVVDATARRERATIESATDVICTLDGEARFVFVNPVAKEVWGHSPEELVGNSVSVIIKSEDCTDFLASIKQLIDSRESRAIECRVRRADGTFIDMAWSAQWSQTERLVFCVLQDITQRMQLERLKQEFVAIVSHDLRTPLTTAIAYLELLTSGVYGEVTESGGAEIERVLKKATGLSGLIVDLLDMEKLHAGKLELSMQKVRLKDLFLNADDNIDSYAREHRVRIEIESTDETVWADGERITQVLCNLIACAIKLSPARSVVRVSAGRVDEFVEVKVLASAANSGLNSEMIFEPYKSVDLPDLSDAGGSRLGLPLCRSIVSRHGGRIGMVPRAESGCGFWFCLPTAPEVIELRSTVDSPVTL
jgi:PAS domain S-box-containing protein